jgi:hypothetical protein
MKKLISLIGICALLAGCTKEDLLPTKPNVANVKSLSAMNVSTFQVNGTIDEQEFQFNISNNGVVASGTNVWSGSLAGNGHVHIFSSQVIDANNGIEKNVISKRWLFTTDGNLFFDEVGERNGDVVNVTSTITGGTGKYKNATGLLTLIGQHTATAVHFIYNGSITLVN